MAFSTFFGPASEDWCEANYVVTPHIAEFWNTVSSLLIILTGLVGLATAVRQGYRSRFLVPYAILILVGSGSTIFHATLTYWGQALDELTMVYMALTCVFLGFELDPRALRRPWLAPFLTALAAAFTVAYFTLRGSSYFVFFVVIFGALSTHCCWKALQLHFACVKRAGPPIPLPPPTSKANNLPPLPPPPLAHTPTHTPSRSTTDPALRRLFFAGQALWAFSFLALWFPDKLFCATFQRFHLHAIFHLTSCTAVSWYLAHRAFAFYSVDYQLKTGMEARAEGGLAPGRPEVLALLAAGATAPALEGGAAGAGFSPEGGGPAEGAGAVPAKHAAAAAGEPPVLRWLCGAFLPYVLLRRKA